MTPAKSADTGARTNAPSCAPPRYNGSCESGIGWQRRRTDHFAALRRAGDPSGGIASGGGGGDTSTWTTSDLHHALAQANHSVRRDGLTPAVAFATRTPITPEQRQAFHATLERLEPASTIEPEQPDPRQHTRSAVEQTLVDSRLLDITGRSIPQLLNIFFAAKIT